MLYYACVTLKLFPTHEAKQGLTVCYAVFTLRRLFGRNNQICDLHMCMLLDTDLMTCYAIHMCTFFPRLYGHHNQRKQKCHIGAAQCNLSSTTTHRVGCTLVKFTQDEHQNQHLQRPRAGSWASKEELPNVNCPAQPHFSQVEHGRCPM